jgi:hypothetical protein
MKNFKIVIYALKQDSFLRSEKEIRNCGFSGELLWCNSGLQTRSDLINEHLNTWLFFIDHDCQLHSSTLPQIENIIKNVTREIDCVFSGRYLNDKNASYLQRVHNFVANTWLEQSFEGSSLNPLLLGGVFLIFASRKTKSHPLLWGAEDKLLAYQLKQENFDIKYCAQLQLLHGTARSFGHFVKRAWSHGVHEEIYFSSKTAPLNWSFWIRKLGSEDLRFLPAILLHFCIQRVARSVQKIRHTSS